MSVETDIPITVKTRIGIDDKDSDEFFRAFVDTLAEAGCRKFVVHARIAILDGLSPKENRSVPPLNYERVYRLKEDHPELKIVLNGGLMSIADVETALQYTDGAMIGRQAYQQPYFLAELAQHFDGSSLPDRSAVVEAMLPYIEDVLAGGETLGRVTRHMLGLYAGQPGARAWRRYISENAHRESAGTEVLLEALERMPVAA